MSLAKGFMDPEVLDCSSNVGPYSSAGVATVSQKAAGALQLKVYHGCFQPPFGPSTTSPLA